MYAILIYAIILIALFVWVYFDATSNKENKKSGAWIDDTGSISDSHRDDSSNFDASFSGDAGGGD